MMKSKQVSVAALAVFCALSASVFAADVGVPDLETRIRNTGSSVPASAIPPLAPPAPVPIPAVAESSAPPAPVPDQQALAPEPAEETVPALPVARPEPALTGHTAFGIGWPEHVGLDMELSKAAGVLPGFAVSTILDSRSLFKRSSRGVWTDVIALDLSMMAPSSSAPDSAATPGGSDGWSYGVSLRGRTDGFQGINPDYASLSGRDLSFSGSSGTIPLGSVPLAVRIDVTGDAFSSAADKAGEGVATVPIDDFRAYAFSPVIGLSFSHDAFSAAVSGAYSYDSVSGAGETHAGEGTLSLGYRPGKVQFDGTVGFLADTVDGPLVPFDLSVAWLDGNALVRRAVFSGGLASGRVSAWSLAEERPFARLDGKTVYSADWNVHGGLTLAPLSDVTLDAGVTWRNSAFGRGTPVVSDVADSSTGWRYAIVRLCRQSIVTTASATVTESFWRVSVGYEGELLDRLYRTSLHSFRVDSSIADPSARRLWDVTAAASFFVNEWQVPDLSLSAALHPWKGMTLSLGVTDGIPLFSGVARKSDRVFLSASGAVTASVRIDL